MQPFGALVRMVTIVKRCDLRSLSPREERVGREPERGVVKSQAPPLPAPLLHFAEEREPVFSALDAIHAATIPP